MTSLRVCARQESWPLREPFVISRFSQTDTVGLYVRVSDGRQSGHGESEPHECDVSVAQRAAEQVSACDQLLHLDCTAEVMRELIPLAGARNALDCAIWDLRAKVRGVPVWRQLELPVPRPLATAITLGIDSPRSMGEKARLLIQAPVLKLKLGQGDIDVERVEAVRRVLPTTTLIVDVNGGWSLEQLVEYAPILSDLGVRLIEQPLAAGRDESLEEFRSPVPLCADESCDDRESLDFVERRYQYVNIKLDKTGGLTEAVLLAREAQRRRLGLMTGCNVGTSLAMAPAFLIGQLCQFVDLDGPLMLRADRDPRMTYDACSGSIQPPEPQLWG